VKIRLESLGCRLNLGEMDSLARALARRGHRIVVAGEDAELCILNTCTVTGVASKKSRQALPRLRRTHPEAHFVVTGCYAELETQSCVDIGADLVVPNSRKDQLMEVLEAAGLLSPGEADFSEGTLKPAAHTRAFLKVQDGCNNRCSYCVVTLARGPARSRRIDEVLAEIADLEAAGFREVVLTGVHLGSWGCDFRPSRKLQDLVTAILRGCSIERIRLSSLEPWDLEPNFFELFSDRRLMPHLHLPLQSASNRILQRMARKISKEGFIEIVNAARERIPDLALTTDIIVGFPGEREEDFEESLEILNALEFADVHVFPFSSRPQTAAAGMSGALPRSLISTRVAKIQAEAHRQKEMFNRRFLGRVMPVLWENSELDEYGRLWSGLTPNYIRVLNRTPPSISLVNQITPTKLQGVRPEALEGICVQIPTY